MRSEEKIKQMEEILNKNIEINQKLEEILTEINNDTSFAKLIDYYYSNERDEHLKLDEKGVLDHLPRGVLSEDGIWSVITQRTELAFLMLDIIKKILKNE